MKLNFDHAEFERLAASLDEIFPEVVDVFFHETEISLVDLKSNIKQKKHKEVSDIAHKIKSSIKTFGATGLVEILEKIERNARTDNNLPFYTMLEDEYYLVKALIIKKVNKMI